MMNSEYMVIATVMNNPCEVDCATCFGKKQSQQTVIVIIGHPPRRRRGRREENEEEEGGRMREEEEGEEEGGGGGTIMKQYGKLSNIQKFLKQSQTKTKQNLKTYQHFSNVSKHIKIYQCFLQLYHIVSGDTNRDNLDPVCYVLAHFDIL